jgi:hypothetical protein
MSNLDHYILHYILHYIILCFYIPIHQLREYYLKLLQSTQTTNLCYYCKSVPVHCILLSPATIPAGNINTSVN